MKTTYQKPTTEILTLNVQQMVCTSPGGTPPVGGTTNNEEDLLSRRAHKVNVWEDENEEEEDEY